MAVEPEMSSSDLTELLRLLDEASIDVWLDGGWGVDALLGRQTRRHRDVDIILRVSDVPKLRDILGDKDFAVRDGIPPNSFVLSNEQGLEVDVHAVVFDNDGNGVYTMQIRITYLPIHHFDGLGDAESSARHLRMLLCQKVGKTVEVAS